MVQFFLEKKNLKCVRNCKNSRRTRKWQFWQKFLASRWFTTFTWFEKGNYCYDY